MLYPRTYCLFDFETTGLDPKLDKVLEIGAIKVENGAVIDSLTLLINWKEPVPPIITQLTGITQEEIDKDGIDPEEARTKFR